MPEQPNPEKIKVNLHGHFLPDYERWWRKEFGIKGENLAKVVTDKCLKRGIGISVITNEPAYSNFNQKSRFELFAEEAKVIWGSYKSELISPNLLAISKNGKTVYFLDGQSIRVQSDGREVEILSFGSGKVPNNRSLEETLQYLSDKGLPAIAEHPLCLDHYGMGEPKLEELCSDNKLLAVEHNAQLTLPNIPFSYLPKFQHYSRSRNTQAFEVAERNSVPVIANDDSNSITHIGTAYTEFSRTAIQYDSGDDMVQSLVSAISSKDFDAHKGYLSLPRWANWTIGKVLLKEQILGLKDSWERDRIKIGY
jgi:hypothetical protein